MLRQSIIHVESDDVELDDEEAANPAANNLNGRSTMDTDMDVDGHDLSHLSESHIDSTAPPSTPQATPSRRGTTAPAQPLARSTPTPAPAAPAPRKEKLRITHDKYTAIQSMVLLHLAEVERQTGSGLDRAALTDWYLEKKEEELENEEQLAYEERLFGKVLDRMVKVRRSNRSMFQMSCLLGSYRTKTCLNSEKVVRKPPLHPTRSGPLNQEWSCTWCIRRWMQIHPQCLNRLLDYRHSEFPCIVCYRVFIITCSVPGSYHARPALLRMLRVLSIIRSSTRTPKLAVSSSHCTSTGHFHTRSKATMVYQASGPVLSYPKPEKRLNLRSIQPRPLEPLNSRPSPNTEVISEAWIRDHPPVKFLSKWTRSTHIVPAAAPRTFTRGIKETFEDGESKEQRKAKVARISDALIKKKVEHELGQPLEGVVPPSEQPQLINVLDRYSVDSEESGDGITLFVAHANGFPRRVSKVEKHGT